jgi:iron(III) transport system permease protein
MNRVEEIRSSISSTFKTISSIDRFSLMLVIVTLSLLSVFIILPVFTVILNAFQEPDGGIGTENFENFWATPSYRRGLKNSLICAFLTLVTTSAIGIPIAYIMTRYNFHGKKIFTLLTILPLMVPPFVGALAITGMLGRNGTITNFFNWLFQQVGLGTPFEGGFVLPNIWGVIFIQTLHLWPLIYLNTSASLSKIDPTLEESARNLGASGFRLSTRVTIPLALPGYAAGALLVFLWSLSDLGTPIMVNFPEYSVFQAFTQLTIQEGYREIASVISIILMVISAVALVLVNRYVGLKDYAVVRAGAAPQAIQRKVSKKASVVILISLSLLILVSIIPHIGIIMMAFTIQPAYRDWVPRGVTTEYMIRALSEPRSSLAVANSLIYSLLASFSDIFLGAAIAYLLVRKTFPGKSILDIISMIPFAIPGIVIGLGYIYMFSAPLIGNFRLTSIWYILVISYAMRRLPYSVRSSHAVLQQVHETLEEASTNLGASRIKTLTSITIPLIMPGLIAGAILTFINCFTEVSTSLMLQPLIGPFGFYARPLTLHILLQSKGGPTAFGVAAFLGFIQIVATSIGLYLTNRLLGGKAGLAFGG